MESPQWSRLLAGPVDLWREELTLEQVCWQGLRPRGAPMLEQFVKSCSPWEGLTLEEFVVNCVLWEGPHTGAEEECEEEGEAERMCDELTATSIPCPLVLLRGRR